MSIESVVGELQMETKVNFGTMQNEIKDLRTQVDGVRSILTILQNNHNVSFENKVIIDRLVKIIDGDPASDLEGLRQRVKTLEIAMELVQTDKKQTNATLKGIAIGLGLTGLTGAGTLVAVLSQVLGVKP